MTEKLPKKLPKKLKETVRRAIMEDYGDDGDDDYKGTAPEDHSHYQLRMLRKSLKTLFGKTAVGVIMMIGAAWAFTVSLPFGLVVTVTIVGGKFLLKYKKKNGVEETVQYDRSEQAKSWFLKKKSAGK